MTPIDLLIALFVVLTVVRGARTGLLAGAFSLVGVVVGASIGSRVAPYLMPEGENPLFGAGITLVSILAFAALGEIAARTAGGALRNRLSSPASQALDGLGGATLGLVLSLMLVWAIGRLRVFKSGSSNNGDRPPPPQGPARARDLDSAALQAASRRKGPWKHRSKTN